MSFSKTCGGVLDADFEELCGRPLWTNDYLKITQVFHTVLIRNIPILNRKKMGEARRFISLVDTLYDHKARLPDGYSWILRLYVFSPSGLKDYGSATLRCKI